MQDFLPIALIILLPIGLIVGIYRLLARITAKRATRHGISIDEEEVRQERVFRDD